MSQNVVLYYDINTNSVYTETGSLFGVNNFNLFFNNKFKLELHYVEETSSSDIPSEWTPWTGLKGLAIGSTAALDNDYIHAVKGTLASDVSAGDISVHVTVGIDSNSLNPSDKLIIYDSTGTAYTLLYSSYTSTTGGYFFELTEPSTASFIAGSTVRVPQALYMKISGDSMDDTRADEGIFVFDMYAMSHKILNAMDYSGTTSLSGTFEHQIMSEGNIIRTFTFPLTITNLLDFGNTVNIPSQEGDWASTSYVKSFFNAAEITQYSVDAVTWRDTYELGDVYYRVKLDTENAVWSEPRYIPIGATGAAAGFVDPTITVEQLAEGSTATASITASGEDTAKQFDFKFGIPKGDTGDAAGFGEPTARAVQLAEGAMPTVSVDAEGDDTNKIFIFDFGIPVGATGAAAGFAEPTITASTLTPGSTATASVTASGVDTAKQFHFEIGVPKGDKGDTFQFDARDLKANLSNYDAEGAGFVFLAIDEGAYYIKQSADAGAWSNAFPFPGIAPTVNVGTVTKGLTASVTNVGTETDAVLDFVLPQGDQGLPGTAAGFAEPTISVNTLEPTELATASILATGDNANKKFAFTFNIPKGEKGEKGDGLYIDASGTLTERDYYSGEAKGFTFLDVDTGLLYIKRSNTLGDWSDPIPFKGDKGDTGEAGTITVGNVSKGDEPSFVNVGTATNAIWDIVLPKGDKGDKGEPGDKLEGNYVEISALNSDGLIETSGDTIPVSVVTGAGNIYPLEKASITKGSGVFLIDPAPYLAYDGVAEFSGTWVVWMAGGEKGVKGDSSTITIGNVEKGNDARVTNVGTSTDAIFNFVLPKGDKGNVGDAAGFAEPTATVTALSAGATPTVSVTATGNNTSKLFAFTFGIPKGDRGDGATIAIGDVTKGDEAAVTNVGTETDAVLDFVLPKGDKGDAFEFDAVGNIDELSNYDSEAKGFTFLCSDGTYYIKQSDDVGDWSDALPFKGDKGDKGDTSTIAIGYVTTGEKAAITNVGTDTDAVLDFVLPKGDKGDAGALKTTITSLNTGGFMVVPNGIPTLIKTNSGNAYPVSGGFVSSSTEGYLVDPTPYLLADGQTTFTGTWTIYTMNVEE